MTTLQPRPLAPATAGVEAMLPGRFLQSLRRVTVAGDFVHRAGDVESCALLLDGTFDLVGNGTAWPNRGARTTPLQGRPVAVFLPPKAEFAMRGGPGSLLLVAARQPAAVPVTGHRALQQSPLLPLAGSGKAYDPGSGEWKPAESFPTAAESLPPRRIERLTLGSVVVERVFAADYKAASLVVDEVVVPAGAEVAFATLPLPARAEELALYVATTGTLTIVAGGETHTVRGEAAFFAAAAATRLCLTLRAEGSPAYCTLAHAGK